MEFLERIKSYKKSREDAISGKQSQAARLEADYQNKLIEVGKAEELYKISFDEKVFSDLEKLKAQAEQLKVKSAKVNAQVKLMEVGQLAGLGYAEVEKQVDEYIASFELQLLKENIIEAKQKYIESLNAFREATAAISATRTEIDELAPVIEEHNKIPLARAFRTYMDHFGLDEEYFINPSFDFRLLRNAISSQNLNASNKFPGTNSY